MGIAQTKGFQSAAATCNWGLAYTRCCWMSCSPVADVDTMIAQDVVVLPFRLVVFNLRCKSIAPLFSRQSEKHQYKG